MSGCFEHLCSHAHFLLKRSKVRAAWDLPHVGHCELLLLWVAVVIVQEVHLFFRKRVPSQAARKGRGDGLPRLFCACHPMASITKLRMENPSPVGPVHGPFAPRTTASTPVASRVVEVPGKVTLMWPVGEGAVQASCTGRMRVSLAGTNWFSGGSNKRGSAATIVSFGSEQLAGLPQRTRKCARSKARKPEAACSTNSSFVEVSVETKQASHRCWR